jgi:hypothetical protein
MSSTRGRGIGRGRGNKPSFSLRIRKPGGIRTPEINEKPPVQKPELTVNVASASGPKQLAHGLYLLQAAILYYVVPGALVVHIYRIL